MHQTINWKVIHWNKNWEKYLFKTANIFYDVENIPDWVYKINVVIDNKKYPGVWATVQKKWIFESHLFDFEDDLYDKEIKVYLLKKIRDNKKFENFPDLKKQIELDIEFAKKDIIRVMTFGTFDIFHPGHKHFLTEASFHWDLLITIIARDENVKKIKWNYPKKDENKRLEVLKNDWLSDIVELGDLKNPFLCLEKHKPDIICLWYDQRWFVEKLQEEKKYKDIVLVRLEGYKPEIYKSSLLKL